MSKRTPAESNSNDEGSDSDLRQEDNVKRAKLTLSSDKTFHDLPVELLERLLVKAVVMEVKGIRLAKSVWKKKADLAIDRLRAVCSQWDKILQNNFCISEIHDNLDRTAKETYRMNISQLSPTQSEVLTATALRDEIFMLCNQPDQNRIVVYDRHNTEDVKDVIALPGMNPKDIEGCSVSNCLYVLNKEEHCYSVSRITKVAEHQFQISPRVCDLMQPRSYLSVSSNGNLVILSRDFLTNDVISGQLEINPCLVKLFDQSGSKLHEITLIADILSIRYVFEAIPKSNGNVLLTSAYASKPLLTEIDMNGRIMRQFQSALLGSLSTNVVDIHGRILIYDQGSKMELLDSELNPLDIQGQKQFEGQFFDSSRLQYNSERNEILCELCLI